MLNPAARYTVARYDIVDEANGEQQPRDISPAQRQEEDGEWTTLADEVGARRMMQMVRQLRRQGYGDPSIAVERLEETGAVQGELF